MSQIDYPKGNEEVLKMLEDGWFSETRAEQLLAGIDLNKPISNLRGYSTTYLHEAVDANSLSAVRYFLEHGADPNYINPDLINDCALWELQYLWDDQDWKTRYEISKLFFQYGADPNLEYDGETLYQYVLDKVYNFLPEDENQRENLLQFYKLLILYGGGGVPEHSYKPQLDKSVDRNNPDKYEVLFFMHEDGYHIIGKLFDEENGEVGDL